MLVHHYYPSASSNVGDSLVAYAIHKALRRTLGPLDIVPIPVNPRHAKVGEVTGLLETNVQRSNCEADLLVVGGSNLLEPRKMSRRTLRQQNWHWGVETRVEALEQIRVPLVLVGMGTGSDWAAPILPYTAKAASEVRVLFQKAIATAVRDEPTRQELLKLGISTTCTGCPVTFLTDRPVQADLEKPLIVSLPPARI
ncbi:MAG TPA: polysaccharide pyruvyl transferase family protein, partial [Gemmatales bacterium]|nr:polysaccharide pyruvyl transferase family protein [Gemmatales bacterium]